MNKNNELLVSLPDFYFNMQLSLNIIDLQKKYPFVFENGIKLDTIYDCFPSFWGGGRSLPVRGIVSRDEIEEKIIPFLERGVNIRYNFTNSCLTEEWLNDYNSNNIVQITLDIIKKYNSKLGITIYSDLLKEYLEKTYPGMYYVWSTTLGKIGIDEVNKKTEKDILVLDYNYNNDFDFIDKLEHPENIEILVNEHCIPNCPYRHIHWSWVSEEQLHPESSTPTWCMNRIMKNNYANEFQDKIVTTEQMRQNYLPRGINKMKIAGRQEENISLIRQYVKWLIKPEYREEIFNYLKEFAE